MPADKAKYYDDALIRANTAPGKAAALLNIHPPSGQGESYVGWPDQSSIPTVCPYHVPIIEGSWLASTIPPGSAPTMLFLTTPGLFNPICYAQVLDSATGANLWTTVGNNTEIDPVEFTASYSKYRNTARSTTFMLDANALTDNGMVYCAQIDAGVYQLTAFELTVRYRSLGQTDELHKFCHDYIRLAHGKRMVDCFIKRYDPKGLWNTNAWNADHLDCFDTENCNKHMPSLLKIKEGVDYNQLRADKHRSFPALHETIIDVMAVDTIKIVQVAKLGRPVIKASDLTDLSPKSYSEAAREGCFTVQQVTEPTNPFQALPTGYYNSSETFNVDLYNCFYEGVSPTGLGIYRFNDGAGVMRDVSWANWSFSLVMFYNINTTGGAMINIKNAIHYEATVVPRSIIQPFVKLPSPYDPLALDTISIIAQGRKDGLPARYNLEGGAMTAIAGLGAEAANGVINNVLANDPNATNKEANMIKKQASNLTTEKAGGVTATEELAMSRDENRRPVQAGTNARVQSRKRAKKTVQVNEVNRRLNELEKQLKGTKIKTGKSGNKGGKSGAPNNQAPKNVPARGKKYASKA